mgnify:FL=1
MIDFFSYISLDFDRLVATIRTWWSFVRQFKVNNHLFVSNDTCTWLNTVYFKTESITYGDRIIVRIVHSSFHLQHILIWFQYRNIWNETLTKVCWWYEKSEINSFFNTILYDWVDGWEETSENREWFQWRKFKTTFQIIFISNIHFSIGIQSILDIKYDM